MAKYRKKPVVIEARQFDGWNYRELYNWIDGHSNVFPDWIKKFETMEIPTLEGRMIAHVGDYIIKGVNGEFYPCKPDIFEKTYELVEE